MIRGKAAVDAAVAKWNLLDPLMVSPPGSARFLPVLHVEEYRQRAHRSLLRKHLASIALFVVLAAVLVVSGQIGERDAATRAGAMAFVIAAFFGADYLVLRRIDALSERALFMLWVCRVGALHALAWSCVMLVVGGLQVYAEARLGGHEALLYAYGAVRQLVGDEPWRVIVGPFLHGNLAHWLGNFAMLAVASAIVGPLMSAGRAVALFVCGSSFGALVSFSIEATSPNAAYVGISAGIFALLGWCAGAAVRRPASFPRGFIVPAVGFAALDVVLAALAAPAASNAGHVAGLVLGLLWGAFLPPSCRGRA